MMSSTSSDVRPYFHAGILGGAAIENDLSVGFLQIRRNIPEPTAEIRFAVIARLDQAIRPQNAR
jgi:hypothetical protein